MKLGCVMWYGEGKQKNDDKDHYLVAVDKFLATQAEEAVHVNIYYDKKIYDLAKKFPQIFKKLEKENEIFSPSFSYEKLMEKVSLIDIHTIPQIEKNPYLNFFYDFYPLPFNFISDCLRFILLEYLANDPKHQQDTIVFFEADVMWKKYLDLGDLEPGQFIINEDVRTNLGYITHHILAVHKPNDECRFFLKAMVDIYLELYNKILSRLPNEIVSLKKLNQEIKKFFNEDAWMPIVEKLLENLKQLKKMDVLPKDDSVYENEEPNSDDDEDECVEDLEEDSTSEDLSAFYKTAQNLATSFFYFIYQKKIKTCLHFLRFKPHAKHIAMSSSNFDSSFRPIPTLIHLISSAIPEDEKKNWSGQDAKLQAWAIELYEEKLTPDIRDRHNFFVAIHNKATAPQAILDGVKAIAEAFGQPVNNLNNHQQNLNFIYQQLQVKFHPYNNINLQKLQQDIVINQQQYDKKPAATLSKMPQIPEKTATVQQTSLFKNSNNNNIKAYENKYIKAIMLLIGNTIPKKERYLWNIHELSAPALTIYQRLMQSDQSTVYLQCLNESIDNKLNQESVKSGYNILAILMGRNHSLVHSQLFPYCSPETNMQFIYNQCIAWRFDIKPEYKTKFDSHESLSTMLQLETIADAKKYKR